jgi:hypothetical protein
MAAAGDGEATVGVRVGDTTGTGDDAEADGTGLAGPAGSAGGKVTGAAPEPPA